MIAYVVVCVIIFFVIVISFNYQTIKSKIKLPKKSKKEPKKEVKKEESETKKEEKKESNLSYAESEYAPKVVVDDLDREDDEQSFVKANDDELKELENKPKNKAGRLRGDIVSSKGEEVKVEDLGEYDENESFFDVENSEYIDSLINDEKDSSISEEIKKLPPEIKAMLLGNVLNKKDD